jgi:hypothetical protein
VAAESIRRHLQSSGQLVVKAMIDPVAFPGWCAANGVRPDKDGRVMFANVQARNAAVENHG